MAFLSEAGPSKASAHYELRFVGFSETAVGVELYAVDMLGAVLYPALPIFQVQLLYDRLKGRLPLIYQVGSPPSPEPPWWKDGTGWLGELVLAALVRSAEEDAVLAGCRDFEIDVQWVNVVGCES